MAAFLAAAVVLLTQLDTRRTFVEPGSLVRIETDLIDDTFPKEWKPSPIFASGKALDGSEVDRAVKAVRKALSKYPEALLRRSLRRVVILRNMSFYGYPYGGTNSADTVYVADDGIKLGYTDDFIEGAVHHEFSSILLRNNAALLDMTEWNKSLPPDFRYRGDGLSSLREGKASLVYDPESYKQGFLNQYATSSLEEDLNVTAEALLTGRKQVWEGMAKETLLKAKAMAVVGFYGKLDKQFTLQWFESIKEPG
ncbi:MAG: hypothetical protein JSS65_11740 [Armatimonadetes bacterium]|nr:hypothetical protein [Armatimonadota bacterium]